MTFLSTMPAGHGDVTQRFGHFDDANREFVITDPDTPFPWINYLGNTRLSAFISQQAGGLVWHVEPQTRRISRYHWLPAPGDKPGFYLYVRDEGDGVLWNPHFGPTRTPLDHYACRHGLGYSRFEAERGGVRVTVCYAIRPDRDAMIWDVTVENRGHADKRLTLSSYLEFGLLEAARELFWTYLKHHLSFTFDPRANGIRYDYRAFEAPYSPAMLFSCSRPVDGFDCARASFLGKGRTLANPAIPLSGTELPHGGDHGAGCLGLRLILSPGAREGFSFQLRVGDDAKDSNEAGYDVGNGFDTKGVPDAVNAYWRQKTDVFKVAGVEPVFARMVNDWLPLNAQTTLERTRDISTDHTGVDGMRFRDTMQDALAVAHFAPTFAADRIRMVLSSQSADGGGNFAFYPFASPPRYVASPQRADNGVWPVFTVDAWLNETGNVDFLEESLPFRDGDAASVYEHVRRGLTYIDARRGPHGLPRMDDADWNDGLALFGDREAESVMLGMQMALAWKIFGEWARRLCRSIDAERAESSARHYSDACNAEGVWDGGWYSRLWLSNGRRLGSRGQSQGRIYLEPQVWAVLSGVGEHEGRGRQAMESALKLLGTDHGLRICDPPYTGIPAPDDPPLGSAPGSGENGSIFCHANAWAVIALCRLGMANEAWDCFNKILPWNIAEKVGQRHWGREPYVMNSTVTGPAQTRSFGSGGIGWLTGTASWMYVAATQEILGIKPEWDGLRLQPCLPEKIGEVNVTRKIRGKELLVRYPASHGNSSPAPTINGIPVATSLVPWSRL